MEGDASVSDFIVRATMREVKRLHAQTQLGQNMGTGRAGFTPARATHQERTPTPE
ncbi:ParB family protein [Arthrobacter sp. UYCu723]